MGERKGTFCVHGFNDNGKMRSEPWGYYATEEQARDAVPGFYRANPNAPKSEEPDSKGECFVVVDRLAP